MPYGYMIALAWTGVLIGAAVAPPTRPRPLARIGYLLGMVVNEVPLLAGLYVAVITTVAVAFDNALATWQGWLMLLVALASMGACAVLQARVAKAHGAVSEPLGGQPRRRAWRSRLTPIPVRPRTVQRVRDVRYGPDPRGHTLDIYRLRTPRQEQSPVVLYLHGGGYFRGDKHWESLELMYRLASRGWVVVSANYRLRPHVGYPEHLIDVKRAVAWLRRHAGRYGIDPSSIAACGSSAGAHLALIAALSAGDSAFQPGFEDSDTRISAAIGLYGYYGRYYGRGDSEDLPSSPFGLDASAAPPVLLVHGDRDTYTSVEDARAMAAYLRSRSRNPVAYVELPGAQHGFDLLASERFEAVIGGIEAFLARSLAWPPSRNALTSPAHEKSLATPRQDRSAR